MAVVEMVVDVVAVETVDVTSLVTEEVATQVEDLVTLVADVLIHVDVKMETTALRTQIVLTQ